MTNLKNLALWLNMRFKVDSIMDYPRLGHINFINCLPLTYSFEKDDFQQGLHIQANVPSVLNSDIISGQLDVSPVSSIVYARNSGEFGLLPDVSITADGEVRSIILVSRKPMEALSGDKLILTAKSETSHCLLKIILSFAYDVKPDYCVRVVNMKEMIPEDASAVLLIGDDALYANHNHLRGLYYYDLGAEWKKLTGLCMVYAVWMVNRGFAEQKPQQLQFISERITRGFRNGYENKDKAIQMILKRYPFNYAQLDEYLDVIQWDFREKHKIALLKFYELAHKLNLIDHMPELKIFEIVHPQIG